MATIKIVSQKALRSGGFKAQIAIAIPVNGETRSYTRHCIRNSGKTFFTDADGVKYHVEPVPAIEFDGMAFPAELL